MNVWPLLIPIALSAGAVRCYDFLEGEALLLDLLDEFRLRRTDIRRLDEANQVNENRSPIVACLTTTPSRLPHLQLPLKSLLRQKKRPAAIRVHLPRFSRREGVAYVAPSWLSTLESVQIVECEDLGPATKLLPALTDSPPAQKLLVVDDDRIYPRSMVEDLDAASQLFPNAALGLSGWVAPHDLIDRPTSLLADLQGRPPTPIKSTRLRKPKEVDVLQGFSGYLVQPRFFELEQIRDYSDAPPEARLVDDVWFSAHCRAPKYLVPTRRTNFQSWPLRGFYGKTSLGRLNRGGGDANRRSNTVMLQYFRDVWRVGGAATGLPKK